MTRTKTRALDHKPYSNEGRKTIRERLKNEYENSDDYGIRRLIVNRQPIKKTVKESEMVGRNNGTRRIASDFLQNKRNSFADKIRSQQRCIGYQRANRAFKLFKKVNSTEEEKKLWMQPQNMCGYGKFFTNQGILKYRQFVKKHKIKDVNWKDPNTWHRFFNHPKATSEGILPLEYNYIDDDNYKAICDRKEKNRDGELVDIKGKTFLLDKEKYDELDIKMLNDDLKEKMNGLDERKQIEFFHLLESSYCGRQYDPRGAWVDREQTIPYIENTSEGFAKSNRSLYAIIEYLKGLLEEEDADELPIRICMQPYLQKFMSRDYDETDKIGYEEGTENEWVLKPYDKFLLQRIMNAITLSLLVNMFRNVFDKETESFKKFYQIGCKSNFDEDFPNQDAFKTVSTLLIKCAIHPNAEKVTDIMENTQLQVWGKYADPMDVSRAYGWFHRNVRPFYPKQTVPKKKYGPENDGASSSSTRHVAQKDLLSIANSVRNDYDQYYN